ncbi:MAG: pantetheine-phosphate adenylyltransferase [Candidatus Margulisiibacteriota bacterium]
MKIAVYPGSFDPVTNGHIDIIERAAKIFKVVYVAVLKNTDKEPHFSLKDRILMLKKSLGSRKNIRIESFEGLLVDYAARKKAHAIIRGLRAVSDFDYEFQMALTNAQMNRDIETVFLMTGHKYSYLSSSLVLQISSLGGDVSRFVPKIVREKLAGGRKWKES